MTQSGISKRVGKGADRTAQSDRTMEWRRAYATRLVVTDIIVLIWAVFGAAVAIFGFDGQWLTLPHSWHWLGLNYYTASAVIVLLWIAALAAVASRSYRLIGSGSEEFKAIVQSGLVILAIVALSTFILQVEFSRGFVLLAIPAGIVGLVASRWLWRKWLYAQRLRGRYCDRVILVGSPASASEIAVELLKNPESGYRIVGAATSTGRVGATLPGTDIPVLGVADHLLDAIAAVNADTVFVVGGHNMTPTKMRQLSWSLEAGRQHLVMAPSLTDIAGPRIHARPVAGLPLVHVETPHFEGPDRFVKRAFDIVVSGFLLLILSPILITVSLVIVLTSPGGIFFSHQRIGQAGKPFKMLKFRSMNANADAQLGTLLAKEGKSDQPLFKIRDDPRITPVGRFIRRYSIDELPQVINVLRGDMSLVGPRPQVAREVALYDNAAARRLIVTPGMTGLWQVSGRSNLTWEESVRLDLYYVENWSLTADIAILVRTITAVFASDGAI